MPITVPKHLKVVLSVVKLAFTTAESAPDILTQPVDKKQTLLTYIWSFLDILRSYISVDSTGKAVDCITSEIV